MTDHPAFADNDVEILAVERLIRVPSKNNGYHPVFDEGKILTRTMLDGENCDRLQLTIKVIKERDLSFSQHNLDKNT